MSIRIVLFCINITVDFPFIFRTMFLTLLEAPGRTTENFTSKFTIESDETDNDNEYSDEDDDVYADLEMANDVVEPTPNCMDSACVASKVDFQDISINWKKDFAKRPTWFDAALALQQILLGYATGFRAPLYSRVLIQRTLFKAGCFVQRYAWLVIISLLTLFTFCSIGLRYVHIETDVVKLWVIEDGRLNDELKFLENLQEKYKTSREHDIHYESKHFVLEESEDPRFTQIPEDESPTLSYQVLIQTTDQYSSNRNILSRDHLLKHVRLVEEIARLNVNKFGYNWDFHDLCFKPGELDIQNDSLAYSLKPTLERLIPCIWISPIDCYFEGSKPLGPSPPINTQNIPFGSILRMLISDLPEELSWKNIDPKGIMEQVTGTFDLGTVNNFFSRSGIGHGYLKRPCIDPLDPECPSTSPNYYSFYCKALQNMEKIIAEKENKTLDEFLAPYKESTKNEGNKNLIQTSAFDILGAFFGGNDNSSKSTKLKHPDENICERHRKPFLLWMSDNFEKAESELAAELIPKYPEYGKTMEYGCHGVAQNIMNWPPEMLLGGLNKETTDGIIHAEALQSVFLLATPTEVFRRFKDSSKLADNSSFASNEWSPFAAREVVQEWARAFTNHLSNHPFNKEERIIHPLASNSISDMLSEYCDFNYIIIFAGYLLMLVYALYSQCRFDGCCSLGVESAVGLALAGVLTVTLSSIAGLGISTWLDINFNAATTQIVPFLALGIGVDNVFLLLHNYPQVINNVRRNELGFLLKETGMSILTTSLNNILAFWAGTILPIPALRSFCGQTAILLTANLVGIFLIYPAFIALDLKRRKAGRRDLAFLAYYCLCLDESVGTVQKEHENNQSDFVEAIHFEDEYLYKAHSLHEHRSQMKPNVVVGQSKNTTRLRSPNERRNKRKIKYKWYTLPGFLHLVYIPLIKLKRTKIAIIIFVIGLLILSIYGINRSSIGLELSDILPENSAPAAFLKTRDKFFSFYPMNIVLRGENIDFPAQQHLIDLLRNEIANTQFVIKLPNGEPSERYWLQLFREWLWGMQQKLDDAQNQGLLENFDLENATDAARNPDLQIAYSLACSYGQNYDCDRVGRIRIVDDSGTINAEGFYNYLYGWHEYEQMFYAVSQAGFYPRLKKLRQGSGRMKYRYFIPPAPKPLFSRIPFYLTGLKDTPTIVNMIREIRAICENYTAKGLENYPESVAMTFWEQYLHLEYYLILAIIIISICVFFIISLIFFNPWAAAMVGLTVLSMTIELAGFMGWAGVKLNPISAVTLITAVGIGVEFTAHVVISFLTSLGENDERMVQCLQHMFIPVIHGGMSTLLGIVMLAFSQFDFVVKYFFVVIAALVFLGMFNGLALLPVLLSLIGPPCEIKPVGKRKNRLILQQDRQRIHKDTRKFMADEISK